MSTLTPRRPPAKRAWRTSSAGVLLLGAVVLLLLGTFIVGRGVLTRRIAVPLTPTIATEPPVPGTLVAISIVQGESSTEIARDLQDQGLVPSDTVFLLFAKSRGSGSNFQPGLHQVPAGASMEQIAENLERPVPPQEIRVTLPEGRRMEEQADLAGKAGVVSAQEFIQLAARPDPAWNYDFLAGRPQGAGLEGYLFPDTYLLPAGQPKAADLIKRMLDDFGRRVSRDITQKLAGDKRTLHEALIVASIVEREAKVSSERSFIAGVYWNRLDSKQGLFADPTVQYAVGKQGNWWPQLSSNDLKVNSPYNTYLNQGLPPGPICNPGLASIQAAANPQGDYLYFVAKNDGSGEHVFAHTLAEHNVNRAKYGQ